MNSGALKDYLRQYVNSIGTATAMFADNGDPLALDVIRENVEAIDTLAAELQTRVKAGAAFTPPPNAHIGSLLDTYLKRKAEREYLAEEASRQA